MSVGGVNAEVSEIAKTRGAIKARLLGCISLEMELPAGVSDPGSGAVLARLAGGGLVVIAQLGSLGEESQKGNCSTVSAAKCCHMAPSAEQEAHRE